MFKESCMMLKGNCTPLATLTKGDIKKRKKRISVLYACTHAGQR
jgi:hypothetical protein